MRTMMVSMLVAAAAMTVGGLDASAKPRKHHHVVPYYADGKTYDMPLTVNKRSFLDPGPVAPVGTGSNYVTANTVLNRTPDQVYAPSKYGNDTLGRQPYVPGRAVPIAEFATGPNIGDLYSGPILGYQP